MQQQSKNAASAPKVPIDWLSETAFRRRLRVVWDERNKPGRLNVNSMQPTDCQSDRDGVRSPSSAVIFVHGIVIIEASRCTGGRSRNSSVGAVSETKVKLFAVAKERFTLSRPSVARYKSDSNRAQ